MMRLVVRDLAGNLTSLCVKEVKSIDGVEYGAPPPPVELTELANRVKILESIIQPLVDLVTTPPAVAEPEPSPLLPEQKETSDG